MDKAMAASSVKAQVNRASLAFTKTPYHGRGTLHSRAGNRAVYVRSLALRPRLATGLP